MLLFTPNPVLHLEESAMRTINPQQIKDLHGLWSAFSKCAGMLENGERLQYLSWRLLNRQTICSPQSRLSLTSSSSVPDLSYSPTSQSASGSSTPQERHSSFSSDGSKPNISSINLEGLVHSIQTQQDIHKPLSPLPKSVSTRSVRSSERGQDRSRTPRPASPRPVNTESSTSTVATADSFNSLHPSSNSSATSGFSSHSVVRGFDPGLGISSYTSKCQLAPAAPSPLLKPSTPTSHPSVPVKRTNKSMFMLGGSSGDDDNSFRDRMSPKGRPLAKTPSNRSSNGRKQTSFNEEVEIRTAKELQDDSDAVFDSDDDEDSTDNDEENAIEEDDDDDAWEDDMDDPRDEPRELQFPRVDSKANLQSRRSILTLMHEAEKSGHLNNSRSSPALRRSRTSTPHGPSIPASPTESSGFDLQGTQPQPIMVNPSPLRHDEPPPALSPRTTRRNMLAGELSESLRKQLLWERQQRNQASNGAMKRAHTSIDMNNLARQSQTPQAASNASAPKNNPSKRLSWGPVLAFDAGEYHQKGW